VDAGPGDSCFAAGTLIEMADGSSRAIESVHAGELVLAYDPATGRFSSARVHRAFVHPAPDHLIQINGAVAATPNHLFYSRDGWQRADELQLGHSLLSWTADAQVGALAQAPAAGPVYNLEVEEPHTYFAAGLLVHNKTTSLVQKEPPAGASCEVTAGGAPQGGAWFWVTVAAVALGLRKRPFRR
jgi:hypothetical protein